MVYTAVPVLGTVVWLSPAPTMRCQLPPGSTDRTIATFGGRLVSWDSYRAGKGHLGGEGYWSASLSFVLTRYLNFSVDSFETIDPSNPQSLSILRDVLVSRRYHRVVLDMSQDRAAKLFMSFGASPRLLCRVRYLSWSDWPGANGNAFRLRGTNHTADSRLAVTPYLSSRHSSVPFFPHSTVMLPPTEAARPRGGLLLGKTCAILARGERAAIALLDRGFTLHTTVRLADDCPHELLKRTVNHRLQNSSAFARLLSEMAFVVGVDLKPYASPTPVEGLAQGAALLNPYEPIGGIINSMHPVLATLGPPYVYNYQRHDLRDLADAAEAATRHRFASFVPFAHRIETSAAAACANLIQYDAPCACAEERPGTIACHGSMLQQWATHGPIRSAGEVLPWRVAHSRPRQSS